MVKTEKDKIIEELLNKYRRKYKSDFVFLDESGFTKDRLVPMLKELLKIIREKEQWQLKKTKDKLQENTLCLKD